MAPREGMYEYYEYVERNMLYTCRRITNTLMYIDNAVLGYSLLIQIFSQSRLSYFDGIKLYAHF